MLNRILLSIIMISFAVAQPSFTAADIATSADNATSVFVADMDNDGWSDSWEIACLSSETDAAELLCARAW